MRVLQDRSVVPLGGTRAIPVDIRIVCATHRKLREMIADGTFREDLYYRINGLAVTLPELAERTDLAVLVERMLAAQCEDGMAPARIRAEVLELFARHRWPGNLRQLANVLRSAEIMAEGDAEIGIEHLPEDFVDECAAHPREAAQAVAWPAPNDVDAQSQAHTLAAKPKTDPAVRMTEWQAALIEQTLARHGGNISAAARELGLARNTVYRYLRMHGAH
jgi:transcriptional regulator of acetoin/glycerol metabolism